MGATDIDQRISRHLQAAERQLQWSRVHIDVGLYGTALYYLGQVFIELAVAGRYVTAKEKAEAEEDGFRGGSGSFDEAAEGIRDGTSGAARGDATDNYVLGDGCDSTSGSVVGSQDREDSGGEP